MNAAFIKIGVIDVIDILLVAFLMYQIYMLIRGTIATYIFITIIMFYVVWLLVKDSMLLLGGILGQIIGVGAIAIIVVFQPELRRFLIMFSSKYLPKMGISIDNLFYKGTGGEPLINVNAIIKACSNLSRDRVGALIVLKRTSPLDAYSNTGENIDAKTTSRLLESIFNRNSPLHDGAVVINQNKIQAAACILPLSDNYMLPEEFGLRHRAAVGLSEQTDALIIVVSEETGNISLAESGKVRKMDIQALHSRLEEEFSTVREKRFFFFDALNKTT
ncbi:MAG: diadenylate cyclase CdaA [Bacteroidales bacterium]|nr:diadenylate cyclase CdaA [Bacteroidales bacterium]